MKRTLYSLIFVIIITNTFFSQILLNNYFAIYGEEGTGRIFVKTTQGSLKVKGDENKIITKSESIPYTSFVTVVIDGEIYKIDSKTRFEKKIQEENSALVYTVMLPHRILLKQIVKFYTLPKTGRKNAISISFEIKNNDDKAHDVKLRYVLDTDLETSNDFAFSHTSEKYIKSEKVFSKIIPSRINVINNVNSPILRCYVLPRIPGTVKPYRVVLAAYQKFAKSNFEFKSKQGASFAAGSRQLDAAIGFYYSFGRMIPSKKNRAGLILGITDKIAKIQTGFTAGVEIPSNQIKPPLKIKVNVKNTGNTRFKIVKAIIRYPKYMKNTEVVNVIKTHTNLKKAQTKVFSWELKYNEKIKDVAVIRIYIKAYDKDMRLFTKKIVKKVLLTAGKDIKQGQTEISSREIRKLLKKMALSNKSVNSALTELEKIDYILYTINTSTGMNAYIAGKRVVSNTLLNKIKSQVARLLFFAKSRRQEIEKQKQSLNK